MPETSMALLADRGVVSVKGEDAEKLLQGIITNDMTLLGARPAVHAALLSPQGKILFDFFVVKAPDGFLLETARGAAHDLVQRLMMYKLRAKAEIRDVSSDYTVAAFWGGPYSPREGSSSANLYFEDPRLAALGARELVTMGFDWVLGGEGAAAATADDYHAHRIALGVPEGGRDFAFGDTFPHEALLDQLKGVSFDKGCYVGQEVVSRMQHRGAARKRIVPVVAARALPEPGADIAAGDVVIGKLGSVCGNRGLALLRLDRAAEMEAKGQMLAAGGVPVEIKLPSWADFGLRPHDPAATA